jgi:hypothetical protein
MIFIKQTERHTRPLFVGRYNVPLRRLMLHHHTLPSKRERISPGKRAGWGTGIEQEKQTKPPQAGRRMANVPTELFHQLLSHQQALARRGLPCCGLRAEPFAALEEPGLIPCAQPWPLVAQPSDNAVGLALDREPNAPGRAPGWPERHGWRRQHRSSGGIGDRPSRPPVQFGTSAQSMRSKAVKP